MRSRSIRILAAAGLAASAALLTGCSGDSAYHGNPAPEVNSISRNAGENKNVTTISFDQNLRMLRDDFKRSMYYDRPSRLAPHPVPY